MFGTPANVDLTTSSLSTDFLANLQNKDLEVSIDSSLGTSVGDEKQMDKYGMVTRKMEKYKTEIRKVDQYKFAKRKMDKLVTQKMQDGDRALEGILGENFIVTKINTIRKKRCDARSTLQSHVSQRS